jgi:hypothetical protein
MINKELLKKLVLNALGELNRYYGNEGCNDLYKTDPLLKGISKEEFLTIQKEWNELFPEQVKERRGDLELTLGDAVELDFDLDLVDTIIKSVESSL